MQVETVTCVVHDKGTVGDGVPASYPPPLVAGLEHLQPVLTPLHTSPNNTIKFYKKHHPKLQTRETLMTTMTVVVQITVTATVTNGYDKG